MIIAPTVSGVKLVVVFHLESYQPALSPILARVINMETAVRAMVNLVENALGVMILKSVIRLVLLPPIHAHVLPTKIASPAPARMVATGAILPTRVNLHQFPIVLFHTAVPVIVR